MTVSYQIVLQWRRAILCCGLILVTVVAGCNRGEVPPVTPDPTPIKVSDGDDTFGGGLEDFEALYVAKWDDAVPIRGDSTGDLHILRIESKSKLRDKPGNHPKILHHNKKMKDVVVLVHGITDSPHYVEAIGKEFHGLGFNVVLPLLPAHGRKDPWAAMRALKHTDWLEDVDKAISIAKKLGERVSMGGFSTGGALTMHKLTRNPKDVTGGVYLFSAALKIRFHTLLSSEFGPGVGKVVDDKRWIAASARERVELLIDGRETSEPVSREPNYGIGANPYKYSVFFYDGVAELATVIAEIDESYKDGHIPPFSDISQPVFIAHSNHDEAADIGGVRLVEENHPDGKVVFFSIDEDPPVEHASVVLKQKINDDAVANPKFEEMIGMMIAFTKEHVASE